MKNPPGSNFQKGIAAASTVLGSILLFGLLGHWMGNKTGHYKIWLISCLLFGAFTGLYHLAKDTLKS